MPKFRLVVFDMAGTTVRDDGGVEDCFLRAAQQTGLEATSEQVVSMMGLRKRQVFETLWARQLKAEAEQLDAKVEESYSAFRTILERHYETASVVPTDGCPECFDWLRSERIAIALTTGFYRKVTDIILERLGWDRGLDERRVGTAQTTIQASIASDEVANGRPAADMIHRAMELLGVTEPNRVVKIGDTPSDLEAGKNAHCGLTLAVTNGTHTAERLGRHPNDGLLGSLRELPERMLAAPG